MSHEDKGCPETEMRTLKQVFEDDSTFSIGMDLTMRHDAPYYDSKETRIAYFKFEQSSMVQCD